MRAGIVTGLFLVITTLTDAAITVVWTENSSGVTATYFGSMNVLDFGVSPISDTQTERAVRNNQAFAYYDGSTLDRYNSVGTPTLILPVTLPDGTGAGDPFAFAVGDVFVPSGYISGSSLSGSAFFPGQSLLSVFPADLPDLLGQTTEVWRSNSGNDAVFYAVIPEPSSLASLFLAGWFVLWKRKRF